MTHLWTHFDGIKTWVDLPSEYWAEEDMDERMDIWNESINQTILENENVISKLSLKDFVPHIMR